MKRIDEIKSASILEVPDRYASWAQWCLDQAEPLVTAHKEALASPKTSEDGYEVFIAFHRFQVDRAERIVLLADATTIYSAMAVEAFLNYLGVRRLGESFYKPNLERSPPTQKLAQLLLALERLVLAEGDEIMVVTRELFASRNALVHPKTKEVELDEWKGRLNLLVARASLKAMRRFFELFSELVPGERLEVDRALQSSLTCA